jgi:hypothetical protein
MLALHTQALVVVDHLVRVALRQLLESVVLVGQVLQTQYLDRQ